MDVDAIYRKLYLDKFAMESLYDKPDYEYAHWELKRTGVMMKRLWQEYQDKFKASGSPYRGYTKHCQNYSNYIVVNKLTNHLEDMQDKFKFSHGTIFEPKIGQNHQ